MTTTFVDNTKNDTLANALPANAATFTLATGKGAKYPVVTAGDNPIPITFEMLDGTTGKPTLTRSTVIVGHVAGSDTFSIAPIADAFPAGTLAECRPRAVDLNALTVLPAVAADIALGPTRRSAVVAEIASLFSLPLTDMGEAVLYKGLRLHQIRSVFGEFRYSLGTRKMTPECPLPRCFNTTTAAQTVARYRFPGGAITPGTNVNINMAVSQVLSDASGAASNFLAGTQVLVRVIAEGISQSQETFYTGLNTSGSSQTVTLSIDGYAANAARYNGMSASIGNNYKRGNLLNDVVIEIKVQFPNADGTKLVRVISTATVADAENCMNPDVSAVRQAKAAPFSFQSPVNQSIKSGAIYEAATDPATASYRNAKFGQPAGSNSQTGYPWVSGRQSSEKMFVYQVKTTDPLMPFTFTGRCYGGPWPFNPSGNTFYMHASPTAYASGQTTDSLVFIVSACGRWCIEGGGYSFNASTGTHHFYYVNVVDLFGLGISNTDDGTLLTVQESYRASGVAGMAGIVRGAELAARSIQHVLCLQLSPALLMAGVFVCASATGTTFVISAPSTGLYIDYTSLFPSGTVFWHGGVGYTTAGTPSYNSANGQTTLSVTATISSSGSAIYLGAANNSSGAQTARQRVWPATSVDGESLTINAGNVYCGFLPMGQLLGYDKTINIAASSLSSAGKAVAQALQTWGGMILDVAGGTNSICYADSDCSYADLNDIQNDAGAIISGMFVIKNSTSACPGGPGAPLVAPALRLSPLYTGNGNIFG